MTNREDLKGVVGELYKVAPEAIGPDFSLRHPRFQSSAGRGLLAAAIRRRLGIYAQAAFSAATYGELERAICGGGDTGGSAGADAANSAAPAVAAGSGVPGVNAAASVAGDVDASPARTGAAVSPAGDAVARLAVGVDIEMIDSLPDVSDFWSSDYYRGHFSPTEIAYCIRQEHPRMHFAARWCAKEALMKCDPRFATVDPATLQVALESSGQPVLEWLQEQGRERLPHAVSLTHTPIMAAAVVAASVATLA